MTGNDFSTLFAPLIRDGRMTKFYWQPSREDLVNILFQMYKARCAFVRLLAYNPACAFCCRCWLAGPHNLAGRYCTAGTGDALPGCQNACKTSGSYGMLYVWDTPCCRVGPLLIRAWHGAPPCMPDHPARPAARMLAQDDALTPADMAALLDTFPGQPLDFYGALRSATYDAQIRAWIRDEVVQGDIAAEDANMRELTRRLINR